MRVHGIVVVLTALLATTSSYAESLEEKAARMLHFYSSQQTPPGVETNFQLNLAYPSSPPEPRSFPWEAVDFTLQPEAYARSILTYVLADQDLLATDFNIKGSSRWFHAPWLARETVHGLTAERRSDAGELALGSPDGIENWAVAAYNDVGGYTLGQVWQDPAAPNPDAARFGVGTLTFKLLFTEATLDQVDYLAGSKLWQANIAPETGKAVDMRLLQLDFGVRDARADAWTGWVFGTFMYLAPANANEDTPFDWSNLVPVGITWGTDPDLLGYNYSTLGQQPVQGWMNPLVVAKMATIRTVEAGFDSPHLGLFGRVNGPVDAPRSSCLACHGRAIDFGHAVTGAYRNAVLPFSPRSGADDFTIQWFFRNLKPHEPFLHDTKSLDYSLQLQVGIGRFRTWLENETQNAPLAPPLPTQVTRMVPHGIELDLPTIEFERGQ